MKIILIYTSKHGGCKMIAQEIKNKINCECYSLEEFHGDVQDFDVIILGSPVYAGMLDKKMIAFASSCLKVSEKVYFFTSGMVKKDYQKVMTENLGEVPFSKMRQGACLGGVLNFPDMNIVERNILKLINKNAKLVPSIDKKTVYNLIDQKELSMFIDRIIADTL